MATATANDSDDDFQTRGQKPMLASQRAKQNGAPSEANRTGRVGGYFTLGYKEGFSQWVRHNTGFGHLHADLFYSGRMYHQQ